MSADLDAADTADDESGRWVYRGDRRPPFAMVPRSDQESVWDYPRPPAIEVCDRRVTVSLGGRTIAEADHLFRVIETASAPTYYLPPTAVDTGYLVDDRTRTYCEFKGTARYWDVVLGTRRVPRVAWAYPDATGRFASIAGCIAFYCRDLDCRVDGRRAQPQPGGFYGGWVTPDIVGPFKGEPGTLGW